MDSGLERPTAIYFFTVFLASRRFMGACAAKPGGVVRSFDAQAKPTSACVPPGECVLTEEWSKAKLVGREKCKESASIFTFQLPDVTKPLGLSTCACILAKGNEDTVRPYTPVSTNAMLGKFELMVKVYPDGAMSQYMDKLLIGDSMYFKHLPFNVKVQYPFGKKAIGMICGGTGITPMIQALHALLGTVGDNTTVSMLYGSKVRHDILADETLGAWAAGAGGRFSCTHVLSEEPEGSPWSGARGHITRELVETHLPPPSEDCAIFVCGPPGMYGALCGPRNQPQLAGLLAEMGYSAEQVVKF